MTKNKMKSFIFAVVVVVCFSQMANAAPLDIIGFATYQGANYNLIYEESQSLVWLDYTKFSYLWPNQLSWASGLASQLVIQFDPLYTVTWLEEQWRLPSAGVNPTYGYYQTSSEMGHLYYNSLGNLGLYDEHGQQQSGYGLLNTGPFFNLYNSGQYYTGTEKSNSEAWFFYMDIGYQWEAYKNIDYKFALAVRSAQVTKVPEPATMLLLGLGLVGLAGVRRKLN